MLQMVLILPRFSVFVYGFCLLHLKRESIMHGLRNAHAHRTTPLICSAIKHWDVLRPALALRYPRTLRRSRTANKLQASGEAMARSIFRSLRMWHAHFSGRPPLRLFWSETSERPGNWSTASDLRCHQRTSRC